MILCFGIFGNILNICNHQLPQEKFISRVAWVVDRRNSSLAYGLDFEVDDPNGMEGNKSVVSRLLSCRNRLVIRDECLPSAEVARERFKSKVMPFIGEDMVAKAVLAVRYIISQDDTIESERKESFKKYLGMYRDEFLQQTSFDVPDFFARVLLYTTCIDNKEGGPYVKEITDAFIEEAANEGWAELKWDTNTQTLELVSTGEKRLSDWVERLCQLRPPITADKYLTTEWLGVNMTDLDPSIWGRTELKDADVQKLLARKINPFADTKSPEYPET